MKLVMSFSIDGGEPCGSYDVVLPLEYDSEEKLLCDFDDALSLRIKEVLEIKEEDYFAKNLLLHTPFFKLGSEDFYLNDFTIRDETYETKNKKRLYIFKGYIKNLPTIKTLDNWFSANSITG